MKTNNAKTVEVKIVNKKGHETVEVLLDNAISYLKEKCANEGKWAFVNGQPMTNFTGADKASLEDADILLTNQLVGGKELV